MFDILFFNHKAWFYFDGYINTQNYPVLSSDNYHIFQTTTSHPLKIGVWCAMNRKRIVRPLFWDNSCRGTLQYYSAIHCTFALRMSTMKFFNTIMLDHAWQKIWCLFWQNFLGSEFASDCHIAQIQTLGTFFRRVMSYLKNVVYKNAPRSIAEFKKKMEDAIGEIDITVSNGWPKVALYPLHCLLKECPVHICEGSAWSERLLFVLSCFFLICNGFVWSELVFFYPSWFFLMWASSFWSVMFFFIWAGYFWSAMVLCDSSSFCVIWAVSF